MRAHCLAADRAACLGEGKGSLSQLKIALTKLNDTLCEYVELQKRILAIDGA